MDIEKLQGLADKLAQTKGPDRELDEAIIRTLVPEAGHLIDKGGWCGLCEVTSSLDAVEALRQRMLPDSILRVSIDRGHPSAFIWFDDHMVEEEAPTEPIARLLALMAALIIKHTHEARPDLDEDDQHLGATGRRIWGRRQ